MAVSFLEKTTVAIKPEIAEKLGEMFDDENPYVGFRAAFALFVHGDRSKKVISKIREAASDEDVREIAKGYLAELEK